MHTLEGGVVAQSVGSHFNVARLDLSGCVDLTDKAIICLFTHATAMADELRHIVITPFANLSLTDQAVGALAKSCHALTTLELKRCPDLTDASLISLATHCPCLKSVILSDFSNFSEPCRTEVMPHHATVILNAWFAGSTPITRMPIHVCFI